nr:hypothetical protein [uncultured Acinetobacter sp.]
MNTLMYANLTAERNTLKELLANIPEENVIDRYGLENRLEEVESCLESVNPYHIVKRAKLTFRGNPVIGSEAISASFATKATKIFSDAVSAISAGLTGEFHFKGKIPHSNLNQLMITGTAIGSFGFELELPRPDQTDLCPEVSITEKSINNIRTLFELAATGTDDELIDILEEIHPRAISKIYEFLNFLDEQDARCGLEFDNHFFRFQDSNQIAFALSRLNEDNFVEKIIPYRGIFQGILPSTHSFEFKTEIDGELIKGKISSDISHKDLINPEWLFKSVTVNFSVATIGNSRPKFILKSINNISLNQ